MKALEPSREHVHIEVIAESKRPGFVALIVPQTIIIYCRPVAIYYQEFGKEARPRQHERALRIA